MLIQLLSIIGAGLALAGFFGYLRGWMGKDDLVYPTLNVLSAIFLFMSAVLLHNIGFVILNVVWGVAALHQLAKNILPKDPFDFSDWPDINTNRSYDLATGEDTGITFRFKVDKHGVFRFNCTKEQPEGWWCSRDDNHGGPCALWFSK